MFLLLSAKVVKKIDATKEKAKEKYLFFLCISLDLLYLCTRKQCNGLSLACKCMREESPGGTGRSTGESASCW